MTRPHTDVAVPAPLSPDRRAAAIAVVERGMPVVLAGHAAGGIDEDAWRHRLACDPVLRDELERARQRFEAHR